jgi:hypothetical protein
MIRSAVDKLKTSLSKLVQAVGSSHWVRPVGLPIGPGVVLHRYTRDLTIQEKFKHTLKTLFLKHH